MKRNLICLVLAAFVLALAAGFFSISGSAGHSTAPYSAPGVGYHSPSSNVAVEEKGFRFEESSSVSGSGEVSIKGSFQDASVDSSGWMKGSGSINLESLRNMSKKDQDVELIQRSDLVFAGGLLKNKKSMRLPLFENGTGATVNERFNLSHVDKSETDMIRSINRSNNSMLYNTALAFEGKWDIENRRGWSIYMNRSKQSYTGSFQTEKKIEYNDSAQK